MNFDFITAADFRCSLESDFKEMLACSDSKAWKAVHVIAGSIIETVLIDSLITEDVISREEGLKIDLGTAISLGKDKGLISAKSADLSTVVRSYRNLIHPGRVIRLGETVDEESSKVAVALVRMILSEIAAKRRKSYGYTAEQIASKLERDSIASAIVPHLLRETKEVEIERLMMTVLPEYYLISVENESPEYMLNAFVVCFRTAFEMSSEQLKKKVAQRFISIFKEESDRVIHTYGTAYLRMTDLKYVSKEDMDLIKKHFLRRLKDAPYLNLLHALNGIGIYITSDEIEEFVDSFMRIIGRDEELAELGRARFEAECNLMKVQNNDLAVSRIDDWINMLRENKAFDKAKLLEAIKDNVIMVPF